MRLPKTSTQQRLVIVTFALLVAAPAEAAPLLHPMFNDHAVLQRGQPIPVYGTARPGADVNLQMEQTHA